MSMRFALALLLSASALAGDGLVTTRFGEQDTCKVTGVTTLAWDAKAGLSRIRFDLAKLPQGADVRRALLRFWVPATSQFDSLYKTWGPPRWDDAAFDGFKVWGGAEPKPDALLDTRFPFNTPTFWCYEFDVTAAVKQWAADPAANHGLCANFQFPVPPDGKPEAAWQRPYLQITYVGANRNRPGPPTELKALYRSGQVFLTWKQVAHDGAFLDSTYRVYRSDQPITAANLGKAELLGEVHRLSQLNYRRTMTARGGDYGPWKHYVSAAGHDPYPKGESRKDRMARILPLIPERFNFVIDDTWPERVEGGEFLTKPKASEQMHIYQGPQLADDTGLFVHTVATAGKAFFAVTSVLEGNENREELAAAGPVETQVAEPKPVLQAVFNANGPGGYGKLGKFQVREYVYWDGGSGRFHPEPSTPLCFTFHVPNRWVGLGFEHNEDKDFPSWICSLAKVAGYSVSYWDGRGVVMDTGYLPPTRLAPFPPAGAPNMNWDGYSRFFYGSRTRPAEPSRGPAHCVRDVFGYVETVNSGADPRKATVRPYFENRRLFELDFVLGAFPADPNFVWASGEGSTLNFILHHAGRIGCAELAQEKPWTSPRGAEGKDALVGRREWALKNEQGVSVWDWNDPVWFARQFPGRTWPFVSNCHSDNYDGANNWSAVGFPKFYLDLAALKQGAELWWCDIGDAPNGKFQRVPRNAAYPVLTRATCCQTPVDDWRQEPRGTLNGYVIWCRPTSQWLTVRDLKKEKQPPEPPAGRPIPYAVRPWGGTIYWGAVPTDLVDTPDRFEMAFRIGEDGLMLNGQSVPPCRVACGAADITPRRLQQFKVEKGRKYAWRNVRVATGQVLQTGIIEPDEHGLLTAPQFFVDKDIRGNKLILTPAAGEPPAVDKSQTVELAYFLNGSDRHHDKNAQVEKLAYADYVKRCLEPELVPVVADDKVFRIADFMNHGGFRDDGLYSQWGGGFDDSFQFPKAGRYRIEVETTKALYQNGAWPILSLTIDSQAAGDRLLDSDQPIVRAWWADLSQGRHMVRFRLANNVFNEPVARNGDQSPKPDRGFTVVGVRFIHLGERPADAKDVWQVQIRNRSLLTCPGLPIRLAADALDAWGQRLFPQVEWKASEGAKTTPDGLFTATKPDVCTVAATAGGKSDTVVVKGEGDTWIEDFDDEWADGWAESAPDATSEWFVTRHHGFIGALTQRNTKADAAHLIVWQGGTEWRDIAIQADANLQGEGLRNGPAQGIAFRWRDAANHYRFEKKGSELRVIKLVDGKETVLATATKQVEPLSFKRDAYPSFRLWSERWRTDPKPFQCDRLEVEVRGDSIAAKLNNVEVLTAKDSDLKQGTIGLWCIGAAAFDNVVVKPLW